MGGKCKPEAAWLGASCLYINSEVSCHGSVMDWVSCGLQVLWVRLGKAPSLCRVVLLLDQRVWHHLCLALACQSSVGYHTADR